MIEKYNLTQKECDSLYSERASKMLHLINDNKITKNYIIDFIMEWENTCELVKKGMEMCGKKTIRLSRHHKK